MASRPLKPLLLHEEYIGIVKHVDSESIEVYYEVDGDIVKQCYSRDQFIRCPRKGESVRVSCIIARKT